MVARIAERTWQCDCCGMTNDQRGCVKGPPSCPCYYQRSQAQVERFSFFPMFCIICGRCSTHCPGSRFYEDPKADPLARLMQYNQDAPINKPVRPHTFVRFGLCSCRDVSVDD